MFTRVLCAGSDESGSKVIILQFLWAPFACIIFMGLRFVNFLVQQSICCLVFLNWYQRVIEVGEAQPPCLQEVQFGKDIQGLGLSFSEDGSPIASLGLVFDLSYDIRIK